ncbi:MAG: carbohydrate-binding protein [Methylovulum sp.]|nr:carbohydrate-binding protein [Methylovulum sp.]
MRKQIVAKVSQDSPSETLEWLDLDSLAEVELTSEDVNYPIESALLPGEGLGWRAASPGKQDIRLLFLKPQSLGRIQLSFVEPVAVRTQEYVLRWSSDGGRSFHEIVRQQWNFSPEGSTSEIEDLHVALVGVTVIELSIVPEISGSTAFASLAQLRLA